MSETDIHSLKNDLMAAIDGASDSAALEKLRVEVLGKKGKLTVLMKTLGKMEPEERKTFGAALNELKQSVAAAIEAKSKVLAKEAMNKRLETERVDITLPPRPDNQGRVHPITQTTDEIVNIFASMGFKVASGPEIETN